MGFRDTRAQGAVGLWDKMAEAASKGGDEPGKFLEQEEEEESQVLHRTSHCKLFNVRMGFRFISMSNQEGSPLESLTDVFVHGREIYMEGFRSLKEGEAVKYNPKGRQHKKENQREIDATTVKAFTTTLKNVLFLPTSQRNAITVKASCRWWLTAPINSQEGRSEILECSSGSSPQEASLSTEVNELYMD